VVCKRKVPPHRKPIPRRPSPAQGNLLAQFEASYFAIDGHNQLTLISAVDDARRESPEFAPPQKDSKFSATTYHSWRRQETSPTIHDLEILARVAKRCLTLSVEPQSVGNSTDEATGVDDVTATMMDNVLRDLERLPALQRAAVIGKIELMVEQALARNPQESDAARPSGARHDPG
jgi:hypothetical protein